MSINDLISKLYHICGLRQVALHLSDAAFFETSPRMVNGEIALTPNTSYEILNAFTHKAREYGLYFITIELVIWS